MAPALLRNRAGRSILAFYNLDLVNDTGIHKTLPMRM